MKKNIKRSFAFNACVAIAMSLGIASIAEAHFPWLVTNDQGHAEMWFGESLDDRTYPMPAKVKAIPIHGASAKQAIKMQAIKSDDLVGLESAKPVDGHQEIAGTVTYGLYHGTRLTYHVEHLSGSDPHKWPTTARPGAALQTIVVPSDKAIKDKGISDEGITVTVLHQGKPLAKTEVKLHCEEGHEEASRKTDSNGIVRFSSSEVEPGLNAVVIGLTEQTSGTYEGETYSSTTDYLTATFRSGKSNRDVPHTSQKEKRKVSRPTLEDNSGVLVVPTDLPPLPEELTSFGGAVLDNKLYVYGGHTGAAHSYSTTEQSDRFWSLDLSKTSGSAWQKLPSGPRLQGLTLVAHENRLIRIGGFTAVNETGEPHNLQSQTSVAAFDPATGVWSEMPSLPEPRSSLDAAVLGDTVYVFGGWQLNGDNDSAKWHSSGHSLNLKDPSALWQPTTPPPFQRRAVSVAAHDGKLFVVGGMRPTKGPTTQVDAYDPITKTWSKAPPLPGSGMSGFGSSSFAANKRLYVSTLDCFVHRLAENQKSWQTVAKADPARFFHRMLPTQDRGLLLIGGANMEIGKFTAIDAIQLAEEK